MRTVSYTQLKDIHRCPWRWGMRYVEKLESKRYADVSPSLRLGRLVHVLLAELYSAGKIDWDELHQQGVADGADIDPEIWETARILVEKYMTYWLDLDLKVLAVEWPFRVSVYTPRGTRSQYRIVGVVDMVVQDAEGDIWIWDHKTAKGLPSTVAVAVDSQLSTYAWALRQMGLPVYGVLFNWLRNTKNVVFRRDSIRKSEKELDAWGDELYWACRRLPPPSVQQHELAKSPRRECSWDCQFFDLCRLEVEGERAAADEYRSQHFGPIRRSSELPPWNTTISFVWEKKDA